MLQVYIDFKKYKGVRDVRVKKASMSQLREISQPANILHNFTF